MVDGSLGSGSGAGSGNGALVRDCWGRWCRAVYWLSMPATAGWMWPWSPPTARSSVGRRGGGFESHLAGAAAAAAAVRRSAGRSSSDAEGNMTASRYQSRGVACSACSRYRHAWRTRTCRSRKNGWLRRFACVGGRIQTESATWPREFEVADDTFALLLAEVKEPHGVAIDLSASSGVRCGDQLRGLPPHGRMATLPKWGNSGD
jgi:hypothetical protein